MFKTKREARLSDFEHPMHSVCTTLLREVRLRFGSKNKSFFNFHFVLRSPCTNFASKLEYWFLSVYMHLIATLQISKPHTPIT